ncbi:MAG: hypothetical protein PHR26_01555 [Candidatus ainarchaeum sp.]|nr:hypothetical protein [Candidatus ainarchaeum sp.]
MTTKELMKKLTQKEYIKIVEHFLKYAQIEKREAEIYVNRSDRQGNILKYKLDKKIKELDISKELKVKFFNQVKTLNPSYLRYCYELFFEDHKKSINQFTNKDVLLFVKEYIHKDYINV